MCPSEDRKVDARTLLPAYNLRQRFGRSCSFGTTATPSTPSAFSSGSAQARSWWRWHDVLLSQTPFHNPAHEPLPDFADVWFDRWDRGGDVTRWYTAELAG